jgi:hypothetical protein
MPAAAAVVAAVVKPALFSTVNPIFRHNSNNIHILTLHSPQQDAMSSNVGLVRKHKDRKRKAV